mmetsp:Transcript_7516/g.28224  ORF Transcript_7516/g.28224 Transcript_7516/m.28224 type:complete len:91 (+) Transcript_7516:1018-1290(+)
MPPSNSSHKIIIHFKSKDCRRKYLDEAKNLNSGMSSKNIDAVFTGLIASFCSSEQMKREMQRLQSLVQNGDCVTHFEQDQPIGIAGGGPQ